MRRGVFASETVGSEGSHLQPGVLVYLWLTLVLVPSAYSIQPNAQQIVRRSIAATETDWKALPHFSDIERDADTKGGSTTSKTYQVLMIDGSPYSRLIAIDDKPLSPAEQALVKKGLWLPRHFRVEVKAKVFYLPKGYIHDETYRNYRRISPVSTP